MDNNKTFNPIRLREARLAKGYSMQEMSDRIGVTRQAVSKYELGNAIPSGAVLKKIIEILDFPLSFYHKPSLNSVKNNGAIYFRSLRSTAKKSRDMVSARANWVEEIYLYLNKYINFPKLDIPNFEINSELNNEIIENIANELRKYWGLGLGPINNLVLTMEKKGIVTSRMTLDEEKIDAFSQWKGDIPFIFLGSDKSCAVRSRFDAAHELGHLLLHAHIDQDDLSDNKILKKIEHEANTFASAFLLPAQSFSIEVMSSSLDHFVSLKSRWKVSIAAMIYRCSDLQLLNDNQVIYLNKQLSFKNMRKKEPLDDVFKSEEPAALKQSIQLLLDNKVKTTYEIIDDINLPLGELENLCNLPQGTLTNEGKVIPLNLKY